MKTHEKLLALILSIILVVSLVCSLAVPADAAQDYPLKIWKQNENGEYDTFNVVDDKTGVNYVVVGVCCSRGHTVAICPRYNADGSLYVSP